MVGFWVYSSMSKEQIFLFLGAWPITFVQCPLLKSLVNLGTWSSDRLIFRLLVSTYGFILSVTFDLGSRSTITTFDRWTFQRGCMVSPSDWQRNIPKLPFDLHASFRFDHYRMETSRLSVACTLWPQMCLSMTNPTTNYRMYYPPPIGTKLIPLDYPSLNLYDPWWAIFAFVLALAFVLGRHPFSPDPMVCSFIIMR